MSDRAVQDEVIRYLADARIRARTPAELPIPAGEVPKARQFAQFLARRYYRDRLARSFRYSHRLRSQTRRIAEEVVDGKEFDRFVGECVMGSLESARCVGEMARRYLGAVPQPGPWWQDLLDYEYAYFLQAATSERATGGDRPSPALSAMCRRFKWALPDVLARLRADEAIGEDLRREVTLLFSRTHVGRIYVVEIEPGAENVFRAADGLRSIDKIARYAGVAIDQTRETLSVLAGIGAIANSSP